MASASTWVKFFSSAQIPAPANATYAHIFVENRIAQDMLSELNKENLREMGISAMGDIISILRHSKAVIEQAARDGIMAENNKKKIIAKIAPASISSSKEIAEFTQKIVPRRVLPEHEGKYKVSLPKGSTKKTREILAKHSLLQSDKMDKKSIFDRLNSKTITTDASREKPSVKATSSIFNRLGSYKELDKMNERKSKRGYGILKPSVRLEGVVKQKIQNQVITPAVKKAIKASECSMESDDSDDCKQVSFSPEVQVRVFRVQPLIATPKKTNINTVAVKSRLGKNGKELHSSQYLHAIRNKVAMKPGKTSPVSKASKMKSDTMASESKTIHSRLQIKSCELSTRVKNVKMSTKSVFNRLGKNK